MQRYNILIEQKSNQLRCSPSAKGQNHPLRPINHFLLFYHLKKAVNALLLKRHGLYSSFFRYLVLYILFALVTFSSYIPIYDFVSSLTYERALEQYHSALTTSADTLENTLSALNNAVSVTYRDQRFRKFRFVNMDTEDINQIDFNNLTALFNGLILPHNLVADSAILFSDSVVLTRRRSFVNSSFYDYYPDFIQCGSMSFAQWRSNLGQTGRLLPAMSYTSMDYGSYEALTYTSTWSDQLSNSRNVFVATLPTHRLISLFVQDDWMDSAYLHISSSDGTPLLVFGGEHLEQCSVISTRTLLRGLEIQLGVPLRTLNENVAPIRRIMFLFGGGILMIMLVLVLIFAYHSSRPISNIMNTMLYGQHTRAVMQDQLSDPSFQSARLLRDYQILDKSLMTIEKRMEDHTQLIQRQQTMLQTQLMDMALRSGLYRPEDQELFHAVFSDFPEPYRIVLFFYDASDPEGLLSIAEVQGSIIEMLQNEIPSGYVQGFDGSAVLVVFPAQQAHEYDGQLTVLRERLSAMFNIPFTFAVSEMFRKPQDLSRAYQQIQCLTAFSAYNRYSAIECAETARLRQIQLPLSVGALQIIYSALNNGNYQISIEGLNECVSLLPEPEDYVLQKHTFTMIANLITQLKLEHPTVLFDVVIPMFSQVRNRADFALQFDACFKQICDLILRARKQNIDSFEMDVMGFINSNLKNPDLCINTVLSHFNISAPTLQKIVKKLTGSTFSSYVEDRRMDEAYKLLLDPNNSVQTVAEMCGYSSSNSFYKVFKRRFGVSPRGIQPDDSGS